RCHATQATPCLFAIEDASVVGTDQLNIGALSSPPDAEKLGRIARVPDDVDGREPKTGELIHHPRGRQPGECVTDIRRLQVLGDDASKVDSAAAEMPRHDVMVAEPVILSPGIKQQIRIPSSQLTITALKEELLIESPHDTGNTAVVQPRRLYQISLHPPAPRVQQQRPRDAGAPGCERRRRSTP